MKIPKYGWGGRVGSGRGGREGGLGVRVDVNREVKIKKNGGGVGSGGGWVGGPGGGRGSDQGVGWGRECSKVSGRWVMWGMGM